MPPEEEIGIDDLPAQGGWMRVLNRDKINEVVSKIELAADREVSWASGMDRSRPGSRAGSRTGSKPTSRAGSRPGSRAGSAKARTTATAASKQAWQADRAEQQRLLERRQAEFAAKLEKVKEQREKDVHDLHEKVEKKKQYREERFERLVDEVYNSDLVGHTSRVLRRKDFEDYQKSNGLYRKWTENVYSKIQKQLHRHINENVIRAVQPKQVGFKEPDEEKSCTLKMEDDPLKQELRLQSDEDNIKRQLDALARAKAVDVRMAVQDQGNEPNRARSRPVLEPTDWGQLRLQATGSGYMAQVAETTATVGETFKTLRRFGHNVFVPDESDHIAAAGKRRTRWAWNDLGILKGDQAHRGEADGFKKQEGQSCGAPMQDHFQFETGTRVTDNEFPLGKKMYPHLH
eukprot:gnl/MRDRNA2_/MRDRNA2_94134_c0_seq1.p1 gnl/MRDRNA2_/MRDRNA2_94134_c0~~gnl/MRDRNA2_/MRDRNA2_94134_c0_seq1.p1  ORF type:complete len:403 (+),score=98.06 gnl/MRDRNA2_/MRDRNA2_94134_c0_seq1:124-1332(+)